MSGNNSQPIPASPHQTLANMVYQLRWCPTVSIISRVARIDVAGMIALARAREYRTYADDFLVGDGLLQRATKSGDERFGFTVNCRIVSRRVAEFGEHLSVWHNIWRAAAHGSTGVWRVNHTIAHSDFSRQFRESEASLSVCRAQL